MPDPAHRNSHAQGDLAAVLPFLFLVLNTFPLTPAVLPLVERMGVPRKLFMPSQFEDDKLAAVRRLVALRDAELQGDGRSR